MRGEPSPMLMQPLALPNATLARPTLVLSSAATARIAPRSSSTTTAIGFMFCWRACASATVTIFCACSSVMVMGASVEMVWDPAGPTHVVDLSIHLGFLPQLRAVCIPKGKRRKPVRHPPSRWSAEMTAPEGPTPSSLLVAFLALLDGGLEDVAERGAGIGRAVLRHGLLLLGDLELLDRDGRCCARPCRR